ncbi:hypothetical protein FY136_13250 [Agrobacterium tumefaciens]|uniref:hypothetical protein n=1 Tax=Agrobacterium tumefaciens TaxID=358 RepID=UPI0021CF391D|nr:hypothetical protein [Agrobacterium tumefaciens]UXT50155.1 hypothetical protein FY136_13250 [Agrobacterium tumefaciens]
MNNTDLQRIRALLPWKLPQTAITAVSKTIWISDAEVHLIFGLTRCYYTLRSGVRRTEADGIFVRYERSKQGPLGYVYHNPLNGENWLWVIGRQSRKPFPLARVN